MSENRRIARELAASALHAGEPLQWFEQLYRQADRDPSVIPWADETVNPNLAVWLERTQRKGQGKSALVVGCGLGDDAEALRMRGFDVTAFDVSATCIEWCRERFEDSSVRYVTADLLDAPDNWQGQFDFVFEAYTLQVLPEEIRRIAAERIASFVADGGTLLVVSRGRDESDPCGSMPWPLVRADLSSFCDGGLEEVRFEDYVEAEDPPVRRFRAEYFREAVRSSVELPFGVRIVEHLSEEQVVQLHALLQEQWWGTSRSLEEVQVMVQHSSLIIGLIDEERESLVGFCRVLTDFVFRGTVYDVMVKKQWQGRGLGRLLMDTLSAHPKLRPVGCLYLSCNPDMVAFYEQWGFRVFEKGMEWMIRGRRDG